MKDRKKALAAIIICVIVWGLSFISIKVVIAVLPPMSFGALRFAVALVFLAFIKRRLAPRERIRLRDTPLLAGAGLFGVTFYFFCENNGVALVTVSEASITIGSIPVITLLAERISGQVKRIAAGRLLGAALSIAGVCFVAGASFTISGNFLGYLYMGGAALCWVAYCFLTRPLFERCSQIHIVFWQSVFGFLGFIPFALAEHSRWAMPDLPAMLHIAFLGIFCSAIAYWFYAQALQTLGVAISSIFINFIPVITAIAGFFIFHDRLHPIQWAGAALVIAGVSLAVVERKPPRPASGRQSGSTA
jgi:drug/metabolite transporter (DMT)-like permease